MRYITLLLLLGGCGCVSAQPAPVSKAQPTGVLQQLERLAAAKPLPVVVVPPLRRVSASHPLPLLDFKDKPLLTSLQALGDICSYKRGDEAQMPPYVAEYFKGYFPQWIPYKFGTAWTIAPEVRDDLNAEVGNIGPLQAMDSSTALQVLVHSLTRDQMLQATTRGIGFSDLTKRQQPVMRAAFGRPVGLQNMDRLHPGWLHDFGGQLPVEQCTLHVYMTYDDINWPDGGGTVLSVRGIQPMALESYEGPLDLGLPLKKQVPNALRPQDLAFNAAALSRPIGVHGITTVGKLVAAAAKATGLPLKVVHGWDATPVFAGDAGMRCGDVLRLLAFDLQGAWRKVGRTYILAWDRMGLGAHNLDLSERLGPIRNAVADAKRGLDRDDWNENALTTLVQDPALPIGPTLEQIAEIRRRASSSHSTEESLKFTELTPDQQDALVAALAGQTKYPGKEPITREVLAAATLAQPVVHTTLDVPGVGSVDLGLGSNIRVEFDPMLAPREEPQTPKEEVTGPVRMPRGVRGIAPPLLGRADWVRLLAQMKRKGLDTLYLPVFWDGQTLFPSKQFPALQTAGGHDVLKEVLARAKADRIHVIAVVHSLAWRFPGSKVHWLTKRQELVDVDALGRGRWDWAATHDIPVKEDSFGDPAGIIARDPILLSDFVRPGDPEVKRRLLGLIAELRAYKDLDGIALAHWSRLAGHCYNVGREFGIPEAPPALGFAMPDRAQFLTVHGEDPAEIMAEDIWFQPPYSPPESLEEPWSKYRFAQDAALARAVLGEMEKGWPGHVQTFTYLSRLDEGKIPAADVTVRDTEPDASDKAILFRVTVPATPDDKDLPDDEAAVRAARLSDFANGIRGAANLAKDLSLKPPLRGVVLDMTASPDLLWDALAMLPNGASGQ